MIARILSRLNKIATWQAFLIITLAGCITYLSGLSSPFWDDDYMQIVNNIPVHSLRNIRVFFEGSTFYFGNGVSPLRGSYYRPLMTTVYSLIYSIFGSSPLAFHIVLLAIFLGSALFLYAIFRYSFKPLVSLVLVLIFVMHPLNSQTVYAISSMGDALFFLFGTLAIWLLLRFKSYRSLVFVCLSLFLCLLSKETGVAFVSMALLYVFWFNRERLYALLAMLVLPIGIYLYLKIKAVGFITQSTLAPIDRLNLVQRLYTAPSILLFYISRFIFPWRLATGYYWVDTKFSVEHVLAPLLLDLCLLGVMIYGGFRVRKQLSLAQYYSYLFFGVWFWLGMLTCLQIIPIDLTACETWFLFSMAGLLGMIGVILQTFRFNPYVLGVLACAVILGCGIRTELRGFDWQNSNLLAQKDVAVSPDDYNAYTNLSNVAFENGNYKEAAYYDRRSIIIYPSYFAYFDLGVALSHSGQYAAAEQAYVSASKLSDVSTNYENMAGLTLVYGSPSYDTVLFRTALSAYPEDSLLWLYLAIDEQKYNEPAEAKEYLVKAEQYGSVPPAIAADITNNKPLQINFLGSGKIITIPPVKS